jgi:hypothetical protein
VNLLQRLWARLRTPAPIPRNALYDFNLVYPSNCLPEAPSAASATDITELDNRLESAISEYFSCGRYKIVYLGVMGYEPRPGGPDCLVISHWTIAAVGPVGSCWTTASPHWIETLFNEDTGRIDLVGFCGRQVNGVEEAMKLARDAYYNNDGLV